jgi:hypothetical protein
MTEACFTATMILGACGRNVDVRKQLVFAKYLADIIPLKGCRLGNV